MSGGIFSGKDSPQNAEDALLAFLLREKQAKFISAMDLERRGPAACPDRLGRPASSPSHHQHSILVESELLRPGNLPVIAIGI